MALVLGRLACHEVPVPPPNRRGRPRNVAKFDLRRALYSACGVDLTRIDGIDVATALKVIAEVGADLSRFKSAKHFTSWLGLCPGTKISGGKVAQSKHVSSTGARSQAESLVERDEEEEGKKLGQDVRDAFPEADFFVDGRARKKLDGTKRFIEMIFSHPFHTPTIEEYGMYHARSAAVRSADLGRQVGAVISTKDGDIIAVGCNEVPKAGGGLYWSGGDEDHRDFQQGYDATVEQREQILAELLSRFKDGKLLADRFSGKSIRDLVQLLLYGKESKIIAKTQILNLLEFGRGVHAEMAALMDAARRGVPVRDATLYSTTFPCHVYETYHRCRHR